MSLSLLACVVVAHAVLAADGPPKAGGVARKLSPQEVAEDAHYVRRMLQHAYAGSRFHDPLLFKEVIENLRALERANREMTREEACNAVQDAIRILPDHHLYAALPNEVGYPPCGSARERFRHAASAGKNIQGDKTREWALVEKPTPGGRRIKVLAISSFAGGGDTASARSREFIRTADALRNEPCFVVDLRGNDGGADPALREWVARLVHGKKRLAPEQWRLQSPEASAIRLNYWKLQKLRTRDDEEKLFFDKEIGWEEERTALAKTGKSPEWVKQAPADITGTAPATYGGKVYALINKGTASCAESMAEWLDAAFDTVKIGTPTSGAVHFGHIGLAILPNSGLYVQMGISYQTTRYGFIEAKGIVPDIVLKENEDALQRALAEADRVDRQ